MTLLVTIESQHFPVSVNGMFANVAGKGRVKTKRYREWLAAAGWDANGKGNIPGPFEIHLILSRKKRRKGRDLDNLVKSVLDLAVTHKVVDDDSLLERMTVAYGDCEGFHLEIRPFFIPL